MSRKLIRPTDAEDAAITAAALQDPDNLPLADTELASLRPRRGRPLKDQAKVQISIRYSPEVIKFFKSGGEGWQARMDAVLLEYVDAQRGS
ncbi:BrnA antitoxin family protein [Pusillimonas sp.]|uniref:BrnA antitoxin family protein n=1 Tax=Pusillimonas sp. TaxID=3040095 RepID=UPI0029BC74F7|nr:BrnA antitoxin family protein [Pusillimonas sp.]MDX3894869.1 BrnA antitoxin family protein [Pusillimonas sp.]